MMGRGVVSAARMTSSEVPRLRVLVVLKQEKIVSDVPRLCNAGQDERSTYSLAPFFS